MTRARTEPSEIDALFDPSTEPSDVPAAPSRPANEPRIMGIPGDTWAAGVERKIDTLFDSQRESTIALEKKVDAGQQQTNANFERLFDVLKAIERHERALQDHQRQLNEQEQARFKLSDRVEAHEREMRLVVDRVAVLERAAGKRLNAAKRK